LFKERSIPRHKLQMTAFLCERLRHCPTDAFARSSNEGTLSG
jgi:hypothetical protein